MDHLVAPTPSPAARSAADAFCRFGFRLYGQLPPDENAFFSPLSVAMALGALCVGARGETRREMASALGLGHEGEEGTRAMSDLLGALGPRTVEEYDWDLETGEPKPFQRDSFQLGLATALFVQEGYPLHTAFCEILASSLATDFFSVAFSDPDEAARRINRWVRTKTEDRIPELISPDALQEASRLVLTNAIYFKASWASQFEESQTRLRPFHLLPGSSPPTVRVPLMAQQGTYAYWAGSLGALQALNLPYEVGVSMLVLLPAKGRLEEVEAGLDENLLQQITMDARPTLVDLQFPKFEMRSRFKLAQAIQTLGVAAAFDPARSDFSGISPDPHGLVLSQAIHEAWVKIDEEGTEAAAATAMMMLATGVEVELPSPIPFVVDRPFLFFIRDASTGAVLFQGRVLNPTE